MTHLSLPALDGRSPLGFLAGLGVLRLVCEHTGHPAKLAWSQRDGTAVLHNAQPDIDTLVADLTAIVREIPADGVLPGLSPDLPPPGEAPDKLRLPRPQFAQYAAEVARRDGAEGERWLAALVTDLTLDEKKRIAISLFAAQSGNQSLRTMLEKPLGLIRKNPDLLREGLVAWRRYPGVTGEYLDHRVLFDAVDSPGGKSSERGVPGATWLALMAYPLTRTTAVNGHPISTCWQAVGRRNERRMVYPLWEKPLDPAAVQALLSHPVLEGAQPGPIRNTATVLSVLSVFWIGHATRRHIPGRKFPGVLAPIEHSRQAGRAESVGRG